MQRNSVMEANRKALQEVLATATVRDSTRYLLEAIYFGTKPRDAAVVDFGIDSVQHLYALAVPVLKGEITPQQLDQALGNGAMLTRLAREAPSSVDNQITFDMPWHQLLREHLPAERTAKAQVREMEMER
jgi:hypothetical protein